MSENKLRISQKPPRGEDGYKTITVRVEKEIIEDIEEIAAKTGRSRNDLVGKFLKYAKQHCEIVIDDT